MGRGEADMARLCSVGTMLLMLTAAVARQPTAGIPDAVGWYLGDIDNPSFPARSLDWNLYTHVVLTNSPVYVDPAGYAHCNNTEAGPLRDIAHSQGAKAIVGGGGLNIAAVLDHNQSATPNNTQYRLNYLESIRNAFEECDVDGIEYDYEWDDIPAVHKRGQITHEQATVYTEFLRDVKLSVGSNRTVSCDVSTWGLSQGSYPLQIHPWVNASMLNAGAFDYVNTMSYHWEKDGSILPWKEDGFGMVHFHGIHRSRVNIGLPYFNMNGTSEPTWGGLYERCPNVALDATSCDGVTFVSKKMNLEIGAWVKAEGWRGVYPWAANYDAPQDHNNNSLATWLAKGLLG